ncbi:tRNA(Met) cytidine acetate ligase [Eubacterium callanderi]|uniref:tRNA(Met) cytidine acetate ligase n=1 Tax=Eubacterium callanderi TaxID=53442 RepID=UPI002673619A|nr:nucleotidyltransferase family protein [Eubacterium callanderi]
MQTQAIICEYNPFHNGHAYQIQAGKEAAGSTHTLALMSGSVVQRGTFAVTDKWLRARTALLSGADLVCELPFCYAAQSAEYFAAGAVKILNATGVCDTLCFGSEAGDLEALSAVAQSLAFETPAFREALKAFLGQGLAFPKARELAFKATHGEKSASYLREPNNILGIEYLKALRRTHSAIRPVTIKRQGNAYHDTQAQSRYASATAIRQLLAAPGAGAQALKPLLPYDPALLLSYLKEARVPWEESYAKALLSQIHSQDLARFRTLPYMEKGLEFKLKKALGTSGSYDSIVDTLTSKRAPKSRIRRILMNLSMGFEARDLSRFAAPGFVPCLRVLGFNEKGRALLKAIRERDGLPVITNTRANITRLSPDQRACFDFDARATDLFSLFCEKQYRYHRDYTQNPVIIAEKEAL